MLYRKKSKINANIKKPVLPFILLVSIIIIGTVGYEIIWENDSQTLIDSLYMTIITITTVGYEEVRPLDSGGRIFTMFISVFGIGSLFYMLSVFMENLFAFQFLNIRGVKKMEKKIKKLSEHVIIVGYGKVGKLATKELSMKKIEFNILDKNFDDEISNDKDLLAIEGDATEDEALKLAGIENAKSIIVATPKPSTTLFVVLSARELNPDIFIIARSESKEHEKKLIRAGADRTINPYSAGGQKMANIAVNPQVMDFIDSSLGTSAEDILKLEQFQFGEDTEWEEKTLQEMDIRQKTGVTVIGIIRDKEPIINPYADFKVKSHDLMITLGTKDQLKEFHKIYS